MGGALRARRRPPACRAARALRGLLFSALPLAVSLLVVLPLLGAGPLGLGLGAGLLPLGGELLRNGLFSVGLGASYALLVSARRLGG